MTTNIMKSRLLNQRYFVAIPLILLSAIFLVLETEYSFERIQLGYWICATLLVMYLWLFLRDKRSVVLTSFYMIFYYIGMLVSALIVSRGAMMFEIDRTGSANGAFWVMILFMILGLEGTAIGFAVGEKLHVRPRARRLPASINWTISALFIGTTILLSVYVFLVTGGPVFSGVDRVTFWRSIAPAGTQILPSLVVQSFFFVTFYYLWGRKSTSHSRWPAAAVLSFVLIGVFVLGQKFSLFIVFLNIWFLLLAGVIPSFRLRAKHVFLLLGFIGVLLLYVAYTYAMGNRSQDFIILRIALQSQVLWSVLNDPSGISILPHNASCYLGCEGFVDGRDYISSRYLPLGLYDNYKETGSNLSGFLPALSLLTLGVVFSVIVHFLFSFSLGFVQRKIYDAVRQRQVVYGFLLFKVQIALNIIFAAGLISAISGMISAIFALGIYRLISSKVSTQSEITRKRDFVMNRELWGA